MIGGLRQDYAIDPSAPTQRPTDPETFMINDGLRDISSVSSQLLLVRGLDQLTSKDTILNIFSNCEGFRRVLLIRERLTQMSSSFAFVEFWKTSVSIC
jgi:RNA recognition motif-containing protein